MSPQVLTRHKQLVYMERGGRTLGISLSQAPFPWGAALLDHFSSLLNTEGPQGVHMQARSVSSPDKHVWAPAGDT